MHYKNIFKNINKNKWYTKSLLYLFFVVLIFLITNSIAPRNFPRGKIFSIEENSSVTKVAENLKEMGIIRSDFLFKLYVVMLHDGKGVQTGRYLLHEPQSSFRLAYRMAFGVRGLDKIKVTIPEGSNSKEIASILSKNIPDFDAIEFYEIAKKKEGYLFPDTYFFEQGTSPSEVLKTMTTVFDEKISEISEKISDSGKTLKDILIMASIIEEEENNSEDRRIISGILWKRMKIGMPLQVDAPFYYLYGKGSSQISKEDLAEASPYNTYKNKGLPIGPISNPSIDAILAAIEPTDTKYWFYLSDKEGNTHYAIDHDGHVANKSKYLR